MFLLSTAILSFVIAGKILAAKQFYKACWVVWFAYTFVALAWVFSMESQPAVLEEMFGWNLGNLVLVLIFSSAVASFFVTIGYAAIWLWKRAHLQKSVYSTRVVERSIVDGSWTAELCKDDVPYMRVTVGSISKLFLSE